MPDLAEQGDRLRVYEQVLREGNDHDVRRFIDIGELARRWNELVLPSHVCRSWATWFRWHGRPDAAC